MKAELKQWAAILMLLTGILGFVGLLILIGGPKQCDSCNLPFCECGGVRYRSVACAPPPGLPAKCYVHHSDPHDSRVW